MPQVTTSRRHLLIALLLPVLALQVLLPAGFMPVADGGELRIVMCAEGLQLPASDEGHNGAPAPADTGKCPFALATFSALPPGPVAFVLPTAVAGPFLAPATDNLPLAGPPRSTAARAPPALS